MTALMVIARCHEFHPEPLEPFPRGPVGGDAHDSRMRVSTTSRISRWHARSDGAGAGGQGAGSGRPTGISLQPRCMHMSM